MHPQGRLTPEQNVVKMMYWDKRRAYYAALEASKALPGSDKLRAAFKEASLALNAFSSSNQVKPVLKQLIALDALES